MKITSFGLLLSASASAAVAQDFTQDEINSGEALLQLSTEAHDNAMSRIEGNTEGCTPDNVRVRKEWRALPDEMRIDYVRAVECLMDTESLHPNVDGARSRFDDFGVVHNRLANEVHFSASFLLFHRIFVWSFEEALRNECNYEGMMPYWNWGEDAQSVENSPLFDGSPTSMGNNGAPQNGGGGFGTPPGSGGGCLLSGPFQNRTVNLGPGASTRYNPRCIKRDLNTALVAQFASLRNTTDAILDSPNIELFQAILQADNRYPESRGLGFAVHGGGHFAIAGDPGGDFNWSPLEPAFYLHHGQMDRLYFIWQNLDWENRQDIAGTKTMYNQPPSSEQQLDDIMDLSPVAEPRTFSELMDTVGETPFCFVYE